MQGELLTRGLPRHARYYKMEDKTDEVLDEGGGCTTGDLAIMDEEGYVRITGRAKDMIIRGGENVYPREIEEFLYTHPEISDVQVYGVPDEKYGEKVAAAVVLRKDSELTAEDIKDYCRESIAYFKVPEYVDFVEEYPMTASGKIQKYKLRAAAVERHGLKGTTVDQFDALTPVRNTEVLLSSVIPAQAQPRRLECSLGRQHTRRPKVGQTKKRGPGVRSPASKLIRYLLFDRLRRHGRSRGV